MMVQTLVGLKNRLRPDIFARAEIASWALEHVERCGHDPAGILDVGLGGAEDLLALRSAASGTEVKLYGIECHPDRIPLPDACLDVLMANHVIEHLKELFFFFSEVSRVLRPGGVCIVGCPNLGGWHNRLALLFGQEPPCMRVLGSHVRGITIPGFRRFIEFGGFFRVERVKGRAFYLAPRGVSRVLAHIVPGLCSAVHFVVVRTDRPGTFIDVLDMGISGIQDTPYFRGPPTPAGGEPLACTR